MNQILIELLCSVMRLLATLSLPFVAMSVLFNEQGAALLGTGVMTLSALAALLLTRSQAKRWAAYVRG